MENNSFNTENKNNFENDLAIQSKNISAKKNSNKKLIFWIIFILLVFVGLVSVYLVYSLKKVEFKNPSPDPVLSLDGNISFNSKSTKLLDLSGYEQSGAGNSLPIFSQYGNWVLVPKVNGEKGAGVMVLGMKNGIVREFETPYVAVSPNFKELAYAAIVGNEIKIVMESIESGQEEWESSIFDGILSLYFGTETNLLNIIGIQNNKTVWYENGVKKAELDPIKYLTSGVVKMSEDKTKVALVGSKGSDAILIINGEEKVFKGARLINLIGFSADNKLAYLVKYSDVENVAYVDNVEVARNISGEGIMSGSVGLTFDNGMLAKQSYDGQQEYMQVFNESPRVFRKSYYRTFFPSFSLDGKRLAYVVDTMDYFQSGSKSFVVVDEKEQKQYDSVSNVVWGGNDTYAYVAQEIFRDSEDVVEDKFVVIDGIEQYKFGGKSIDVPNIESYQLAVNPVNGKVGYVVCHADVKNEKDPNVSEGVLNLGTVTEIMHHCFVIYDGKAQPEFGLISEKLQFTPDGEHILYLAGEKGDNFGKNGPTKLVMDGKVVNIEGMISGNIYFNSEGNRIGLYVFKNDNTVWWETYGIDEVLKNAKILENKNIENM